MIVGRFNILTDTLWLAGVFGTVLRERGWAMTPVWWSYIPNPACEE